MVGSFLAHIKIINLTPISPWGGNKYFGPVKNSMIIAGLPSQALNN